MDVQEKRLVLFDALLSGRGLQQLVDTAAAVMENPVAIIDMGLSPVSSSSELHGDPEWMRHPTDASVDDVKQAVRKGDLRRVYSGDETVLGEYSGAEQRYLAARIRRGDNVLGHALVIERNRQFETGDWDLLPDICRTFGYELAGQRDIDQLSERYGALLEDIVKGNVSDQGEIEKRMQRARIRVAGSLVVLVFSPVSYEGQISPRHLRQQLTIAFPGSLGIVEGEEVVLVVDADLTRGDFASVLSRRVYIESLFVGMSREFCGLWDIRLAFTQASAAIRLSRKADGAAKVVHYDEVVVAHLLECAGATQDVRVFNHPSLDALAKADELDNGTCLHDLEAYLLSGRDAAAAARLCCVHKNTMYYRLKKIESIAGVDLSDGAACFALQLSLAIKKASR